jgi:hypothetical protein
MRKHRPPQPDAGPRAAVPRRLEAAAFGAICAAYLAASVFHWDLPGLFQDETFSGLGALKMFVPIDHHLSGITTGVHLGGRFLPLMHHPLHGALGAYWALPFVLLFGPTTLAVRAAALAVGLLTLFVFHRLLRSAFGTGTALAAGAVLALHPSFVAGTRIAAFGPLNLLIAAGSVWALERAFRARSLRWFYAGQFALGLGMSAYSHFVYFLFAVESLVLTAVLSGRGPWGTTPLRVRARRLAAGAGCVAAGAGLLVAYNLATGFASYRFLRAVHSGALESYARFHDSGATLLTQAARRLRSVADLLDGRAFTAHTAFQDNLRAFEDFFVPDGVFPFLVLAAWAFLAVRSAAAPRSPARAPERALAGGMLVYLAAASFWSTDYSPTHVIAFLLPAAAVVGRAFASVAEALRSRSPALAAGLLAWGLGGAAAGEVRASVSYHAYLNAVGGVGVYSHVQPELVRWLLARGVTRPVVLDAWLEDNLRYLSGGRLVPRTSGAGMSPGPETDRFLEAQFADPDRLYLHLDPALRRLDPGYRSDFEALARRRGYRIRTVRLFYQRDGRPSLHLVRLEPRARAGRR